MKTISRKIQNDIDGGKVPKMHLLEIDSATCRATIFHTILSGLQGIDNMLNSPVLKQYSNWKLALILSDKK